MKISDYKGEAALDLLADLIDPITAICGDKRLIDKIRNAYNDQSSIMQLVKPLLQDHKKSIVSILSAIDGVTVEEEEKTLTVFTLPQKITDILSDPEFKMLFTLQSQMKDLTLSGSASEKNE